MKEGSQPLEVNNTKGLVRAFDVKTGKLLWTFRTIPQKGEFGYDTWENGSADKNGNTGVWTGITVDPALNSVYLPVEDPTNDAYGGARPGNNLYRRQSGLRRSHHRQAEMVLPDRPSSDLGLRPFLAAAAGRHHRQGQADQGRGGARPSKPSSMSSTASPASRSGRSWRSRCRKAMCRAKRPPRPSPSRPSRRLMRVRPSPRTI